jgi:hypothetical protein
MLSLIIRNIPYPPYADSPVFDIIDKAINIDDFYCLYVIYTYCLIVYVRVSVSWTCTVSKKVWFSKVKTFYFVICD